MALIILVLEDLSASLIMVLVDLLAFMIMVLADLSAFIIMVWVLIMVMVMVMVMDLILETIDTLIGMRSTIPDVVIIATIPLITALHQMHYEDDPILILEGIPRDIEVRIPEQLQPEVLKTREVRGPIPKIAP